MFFLIQSYVSNFQHFSDFQGSQIFVVHVSLSILPLFLGGDTIYNASINEVLS
jgi:hypothetical protein